MYKVKICGVTREETAAVLNEAMPDFTGFILSRGFSRSVARGRAAAIRKQLLPAIETVGVFVNEPPEGIAPFIEEGIIGWVQFHGDEDEDYIAAFKAKYPAVPVVKAVGVSDGRILAYPSNADYLLLDAMGKAGRGGTGKRIDWRPYEADKPIFLAGGLTPENVQEAIRAVRPYGVDSSGGVETDGEKDEKKIRLYVKNIREVR